jgi:pimeloyl-ACP methyl ester carboxylesterase
MKTSTVSSALIVALLATAEVGMAQPAPMSRATVDGVTLDYTLSGSGEPVMLVHAGIFADWFKPLLGEPALTGRHRVLSYHREPLLGEPALTGRHRVLSYHRVGYAGSSRVAGPVSIAQQAGHLRSLMRQLGIARAHLVGHSSGGNIALQLALDTPEMVHSIVLMEPALPVALGPERMLSTRAAMAPVFEAYRAGDRARAVDGFMRSVSGPDYRAGIDRVLPGAFEQGVKDADTFFGQELPAIQQWTLRRENAGRITQPVFSVVGAKSPEVSPIWSERHEMILGWLPKAEGFVLPDATHLLHVQHPRVVAEALAAFFARHPLRAP